MQKLNPSKFDLQLILIFSVYPSNNSFLGIVWFCKKHLSGSEVARLLSYVKQHIFRLKYLESELLRFLHEKHLIFFLVTQSINYFQSSVQRIIISFWFPRWNLKLIFSLAVFTCSGLTANCHTTLPLVVLTDIIPDARDWDRDIICFIQLIHLSFSTSPSLSSNP